MTSIRSYRDLIVWQRAMKIAEETYRLTRGFPREEMFGLTSQARRAAVQSRPTSQKVMAGDRDQPTPASFASRKAR